jgi:hypothetical protein
VRQQAILPVLAEAAGDGEVSGAAASEVRASGILATKPREIVHGVMGPLEVAAGKRLGTLLLS